MTQFTSIADALTGHRRASVAVRRIGKSDDIEQLAASIKRFAPPESHRRLLFIEVRRMESVARRLSASACAFDKHHAERVAETAAQLRRIASTTE